jgi:hypothetical protein
MSHLNQILGVAAVMRQQWGVIQLFMTLTGVAIIELTKTKFNKVRCKYGTA